MPAGCNHHRQSHVLTAGPPHAAPRSWPPADPGRPQRPLKPKKPGVEGVTEDSDPNLGSTLEVLMAVLQPEPAGTSVRGCFPVRSMSQSLPDPRPDRLSSTMSTAGPQRFCTCCAREAAVQTDWELLAAGETRVGSAAQAVLTALTRAPTSGGGTRPDSRTWLWATTWSGRPGAPPPGEGSSSTFPVQAAPSTALPGSARRRPRHPWHPRHRHRHRHWSDDGTSEGKWTGGPPQGSREATRD
ncbi:hypothetical protein CB1_000377004 [Camelus ferus]|nr:hypothetical protein CB1_000377004 [Camelus ferus]